MLFSLLSSVSTGDEKPFNLKRRCARFHSAPASSGRPYSIKLFSLILVRSPPTTLVGPGVVRHALSHPSLATLLPLQCAASLTFNSGAQRSLAFSIGSPTRSNCFTLQASLSGRCDGPRPFPPAPRVWCLASTVLRSRQVEDQIENDNLHLVRRRCNAEVTQRQKMVEAAKQYSGTEKVPLSPAIPPPLRPRCPLSCFHGPFCSLSRCPRSHESRS